MSTPEVLAASVFVIRNQDNRYLTKKHLWRCGAVNNELFRAKEKDIALNELIEVNSKDIMARLEIIECDMNTQRQPVVDVLTDDPLEMENTAPLSVPPHLELVQNTTQDNNH